MKVIVAGSRSFTDYDLMCKTLDHWFSKLDKKKLIIISGHAIGADRLGERYAFEHMIPYQTFPVTNEDWEKKGKAAGHIRNSEMVAIADAAIFFHDGQSSGTANCIELAKKKGIKVKIVTFEPKKTDKLTKQTEIKRKIQEKE